MTASTARVLQAKGAAGEEAAAMFTAAAERANKAGKGQIALQYSTAAESC